MPLACKELSGGTSENQNVTIKNEPGLAHCYKLLKDDGNVITLIAMKCFWETPKWVL